MQVPLENEQNLASSGIVAGNAHIARCHGVLHRLLPISALYAAAEFVVAARQGG